LVLFFGGGGGQGWKDPVPTVLSGLVWSGMGKNPVILGRWAAGVLVGR